MRLYSLLIPVALIGGCTVGPDYHRPTVAGQAHNFVEPSAPGPVDVSWWQAFGDPTLTSLVERAISANPDMQEATARIAEARASRDAARGAGEPQLTAKGSANENVLSKNGQLPIGNIPGFKRSFPLHDIGFDASWELDLWGKNRREVEAANARLEGATYGRRDVMLSLIAELARNYMDLRLAQADAAALSATATADAELARLSQLRYAAGEISKLDADQAEAAARASAAAVPDASARGSAAAYRIAALIGSPPEDVAPALLQPAPLPAMPDTILTGVRSELLSRRPDVGRAERELAAATADVGVAKADLFPRFSLLGSSGQQARKPGDLFSSGSTRLQIGPSFSWPIFQLGTIRAQIRGANARQDEAAARYEKAVLGALSDSETAINRFLKSRAALIEAEASLESQQSALKLEVRRAESGEDDRLSLERARESMLAAQRRRNQAANDKSQAAITLYKALGGGWRD